MPASSASDLIALLRRIPLFADTSENDLRVLAATCREDAYERDVTIFLQDDPADRVWVVQQGQVKIVYQEPDGRDMILELIAAGEVFGGGVLFFPAHPATAKAMEACTLVSFSSEAYARFLAENPKVCVRLIRMLGRRHYSMLSMQALAGERTERRIAHILLKLASRLGQPDPEGTLISLPLSRQDIADMAGTTLETAIRTCSRFSSQGLIHTRQGGLVVLLDEARLRQLAQTGPAQE